MHSIIIGTAGHVDHGKTTLIKALTGIDTDRLKEEQERGMTIDIGFASLRLPNGRSVGIVDVPGHERFIKNMLAGAGGMDLALLVIAADESVMPQTVEHLEILQLLEVKHGVVALTKADMVDAEWIEVVKDDVRRALTDTFLADAPIIPVSSVSSEGLPELLSDLQDACEAVQPRADSGAFRLPVDRIFTLMGFGTVVTGTLAAGTVKVGDEVEVLPKSLRTRVRQIQTHGQKVESVSAGARAALNLVGLEVSDIERGDVCAPPGALKASTSFDLRLVMLKDAPKSLKNRARVRFHVGTAELIGRIVLLDRDELKPGEEAYAQFKSEAPGVAARGDRFVIRSYSPMATIGGGMILDPVAQKHKRFADSVLSDLETNSLGTPEELLEQALKQSPTGMTATEISDMDSLDALEADGRVIEIGGRFMHVSVLGQYGAKIESTLREFHEKNPLKAGMPKEELRNSLRPLDSRIFSSVLAYLASKKQVSVSVIEVALPGREVSLSPDQQTAMRKMSDTLEKAGFSVPSQDELLQNAGGPKAKDILGLLLQQGVIVKVADGLYFHRHTMEDAGKLLRDYLEKNGRITVSQFRDLTGSSRKYAVPLLEYFDSKKITRRVGDERVLAVKH